MKRRNTIPIRPRAIPSADILAGMSQALSIDVDRLELRIDSDGERVFFLDGRELIVDLQPNCGGGRVTFGDCRAVRGIQT